MKFFLAQLMTAVLFAVGGLTLFQINLLPAKKNLLSMTKTAAKAKRVRINASTSLSKIEKIAIRIQTLLKRLRKKWSYFYILVIICFFSGAVIGYICFTNVFLALVTGVVCTPLSYLYLMLRTQESTRQELAALENTMSIITNSYMATNDIVRAVETYVMEKNHYVDETELTATPFDEFVADYLYLNPNVKQGLERLAAKINNRYFSDWVNTLKLCMDNKNMRFALRPIIDAMVDEKTMQVESDSIMQQAWGNYLSVVGIMFSIIPALRVAQKAWYVTLTQTPVGQIFILSMLITALLTGAYVMRLNRPISTT